MSGSFWILPPGATLKIEPPLSPAALGLCASADSQSAISDLMSMRINFLFILLFILNSHQRTKCLSSDRISESAFLPNANHS